MAERPFRLWKLPLLAQRHILLFMDYMELLDLTFMSSPINCAAYGLQLPTPNFYWHVKENYIQIDAMLLDQNNRNFKIAFRIARVPKNTMNKKLKGKRMPMKRSGKMFTLKSGTDMEENIKILEDLTEHLLKIFNVSEYFMRTEVNLFDTSIMKNTLKFTEINLKQQDLTRDQARILLEVMEIDDLHMYYARPIVPKGPEDFQLKHRITHLGNTDWLKFSSVLKNDCEELVMSRMNHMTQKDFSDFIRTWARGEMEKLREFRTDVPHIWEQRDFHFQYIWRNEVYESLTDMELTIVKAPRDGHTKVIQRNDGKRAEITFTNHFKFKVL